MKATGLHSIATLLLGLILFSQPARSGIIIGNAGSPIPHYFMPYHPNGAAPPTVIVNHGVPLASGIAAAGYFTVSDAEVDALVASGNDAALIAAFVTLVSDDFVSGMTIGGSSLGWLGEALPGFYLIAQYYGDIAEGDSRIGKTLYTFFGDFPNLDDSRHIALVRHAEVIDADVPEEDHNSISLVPMESELPPILLLGTSGTAFYHMTDEGNYPARALYLKPRQGETPHHMLCVEASNGGFVVGMGSYDVGATAHLTALGSPFFWMDAFGMIEDGINYELAVWIGNASGSTNPLPVVMDSDKTISAVFQPIEYSLSTVPGVGGSITGGGIYAGGSIVHLTATADSGYEFIGWSGDASGSENPLTVWMDGDKTIGATFREISQQPQFVVENVFPGQDLGTIPWSSFVTLSFYIRNVGNAAATGIHVYADGSAGIMWEPMSWPFYLNPGEGGYCDGVLSTFGISGPVGGIIHIACDQQASADIPFSGIVENPPPPDPVALTSLVISPGALTPAFSSGVLDYQVLVPFSTCDYCTITAATSDSSPLTVNGISVASAQASPSINLAVGTTAIHIVMHDSYYNTVTTYTVTVMRMSPYESWAATACLTNENANPLAVPFSDGVANLLKYAFNMTGNAADVRVLVPVTGTAGLPCITRILSGPQPIMRIEYLCRKNSDLTYTPRKSFDLTNWQQLTATPVVTDLDREIDWQRVVIEEPVDPVSTPKCFGRVEVGLLAP